jgi:hypothetical protein
LIYFLKNFGFFVAQKISVKIFFFFWGGGSVGSLAYILHIFSRESLLFPIIEKTFFFFLPPDGKPRDRKQPQPLFIFHVVVSYFFFLFLFTPPSIVSEFDCGFRQWLADCLAGWLVYYMLCTAPICVYNHFRDVCVRIITFERR